MTKEGCWPDVCPCMGARCVSGVCLHGGPERPSREAVKANPGNPVMLEMSVTGYPPRKPTKEWNQPKGKKCAAINEAINEPSTKPKGAGELGSALASVEMQSLEPAQALLWSSIFYVPISPFWYSSAYSVTLYVGSM